MRRLAAFVLALAALVFVIRPAHACGNAVLAEDPHHVTLRAANDALEEGDVGRARELASQVVAQTNDDALRGHAKRTVALSWIRDRNASKEDIDRETHALRNMLGGRDFPDPSLQAELGEAYARGGQDEAAYQTLSTLDAKDLMGSPYAYAALSRVAAKRGDTETAKRAAKRCAEITSNPSICRGEYPSPRLLRGNLFGYAVPGVLVVFALVRRRRASKQPWSEYGDKVFAALIVATIGFVFAYARSPMTTTLGTLAALLVIGVAQRLAFVAMVKRGRVPGFVLRDAAAEDVALPPVASFFHSGAQVLERVPDQSYREPARVGVLRLTPRRRGALALVIAGVFVLALFSACTMATMRTRTMSASASVR
jgi:hypothetical protein